MGSVTCHQRLPARGAERARLVLGALVACLEHAGEEEREVARGRHRVREQHADARPREPRLQEEELRPGRERDGRHGDGQERQRRADPPAPPGQPRERPSDACRRWSSRARRSRPPATRSATGCARAIRQPRPASSPASGDRDAAPGRTSPRPPTRRRATRAARASPARVRPGAPTIRAIDDARQPTRACSSPCGAPSSDRAPSWSATATPASASASSVST